MIPFYRLPGWSLAGGMAGWIRPFGLGHPGRPFEPRGPEGPSKPGRIERALGSAFGSSARSRVWGAVELSRRGFLRKDFPLLASVSALRQFGGGGFGSRGVAPA